MSDPKNDNDLKQHIIDHFERNEAQWDRLKTYVADANAVPEEEMTAVQALQKEKSFLRRSVRRTLAKFRRKYRKSYRKAADAMVKEWRPNYDSRLAKARPYQQDISRITKHEIRSLQNVHGIMKKINALCDDIKKEIGKLGN